MNPATASILDATLAFGATARLVLLLLSDSLGQWFWRDPIELWYQRKPSTLRYRLFTGAVCPWCIGFWVGLTVILLTLLAHHLGGIPLVCWRVLSGSLTLNLIVAPIVLWLESSSE